MRTSGPEPAAAARTLDPAEVDRFARLAEEWWNPAGKFRALHRIGPARLGFIRDWLTPHFGRPATGLRPLAGLSVLDVGCGGGLVAEPLARMGAAVTGIEPAEDNIAAARRHAEGQDLAITYRAARAEDLAGEGAHFDAVVCLEVLEHVPDPAALIRLLADLVRPGGALVVSTLNRTLKAFALAIVGAEYVLGWLPVGTHQWERFITPDELDRHLAAAGLRAPHHEGLLYDPIADRWSRGADLSVNYVTFAAKPAA
jgi:2-polyprenyl-6-hydroxyphenyl methylase/3-demethylubiquinone-9 3-methyltransferase